MIRSIKTFSTPQMISIEVPQNIENLDYILVMRINQNHDLPLNPRLIIIPSFIFPIYTRNS